MAILSLLWQKVSQCLGLAEGPLCWLALRDGVVGRFHSATRCALGIPQTRRGIGRSVPVETLLGRGRAAPGVGLGVCSLPLVVLQGRVVVAVQKASSRSSKWNGGDVEFFPVPTKPR